MKNNVILAVYPEYSQKLLSGYKDNEYRRTIPKIRYDGQRWYIYETAPTKKIVGFFTVKNIRKTTVEYLEKVSEGYAIEIEKVIKFQKPIYPPFKHSIRNFIYCTEEIEEIMDSIK